MDFIANIYGLILNLIKNIMVAFGGDLEAIDKLITEFEASQKKEEEDATV